MIPSDGYGVVYTPQILANFTAKLLVDELVGDPNFQDKQIKILDPACGQGILLQEFSKEMEYFKNYSIYCIGIDIDNKVINQNNQMFNEEKYQFICGNTIIPSDLMPALDYWKQKLKEVDIIIANPPWSSEKVFAREQLTQAGYEFFSGQYNSYVLFIEICIKLVRKGGLLAFIIPDSLFSGENTKLRELLIKNTQIKMIARLGEKIFPDVNRATSIIVLKNCSPETDSLTKCYRLDTRDRKKFISGFLNIYNTYKQKSHSVLQSRFEHNKKYIFDIDTRKEEEALIKKIADDHIEWGSIFHFGRGVEISKSGAVVKCQYCKCTQGYTKKQLNAGNKICQFCGQTMEVSKKNIYKIITSNNETGYLPLLVGENLQRYQFDGVRYILPDVNGINYKNNELFRSPKLLIRKTGLGIYACIDYKNTYISQTIYSCNFVQDNNSIPLEYFLGVLNSRVMYYYYLKTYGENEWKSHPYLTKDIIFSLPIKQINQENEKACLEIAKLVCKIQKRYSRQLDLEIERNVLELYNITDEEVSIIANELNRLPDLSAINQMKTSIGELHV